MTWVLLIGVVLVLAVTVVALQARRAELASLAWGRAERTAARERGSHQARLQYPQVDLSRCIGCGICVAACPEEGVLELLHGQAQVVHGARCVGHARCAAECPVGAIAVTLGDLSERRDIPALTDAFEVPSVPGLFLAGEVTGHALIRTAIAHGTTVADEVARRVEADGGRRAPARQGATAASAAGRASTSVALLEAPARGEEAPADEVDLLIVGAGPAGLACALEARRRGLDLLVLEQDTLGGTVSKYPRRKLVMTQPVELPLHGKLARTSYSKEELMELWTAVARRHELPVREGQEFTALEPRPGGGFLVRTRTDVFAARHVALALGRRGTPRKLGVPGEELPKVAYSLLDAASYTDRRVLVVGGGDSAIEAAVGLAEQPGNRVTISYRKHDFFRLKARNESRVRAARAEGRIDVVFESEVEEIRAHSVRIRRRVGDAIESVELENDDVFVLAGGIPPFQVLEGAGVSFDPADRPQAPAVVERGTGLLPALVAALALALVALAWAVAFRGYYQLPLEARYDSGLHRLLRPSGLVGLAFGVAAAALIGANLTYLLRRSPRVPLRLGDLRAWMTSHLATGVGALLLAVLHSAMAPRDTVGGHALAGLAVLVTTGAIGRYFYAFVPRAANGRELLLEEVQARIAAISSEWDASSGAFAERARERVSELAASGRWQRSFPRRLLALVAGERRLRRILSELESDAREEGLAADQARELVALARRAHRAALMASHYEDLRGLLATWRYLHRWVALLMVLLVVAHVIAALRYAELPLGGGG